VVATARRGLVTRERGEGFWGTQPRRKARSAAEKEGEKIKNFLVGGGGGGGRLFC